MESNLKSLSIALEENLEIEPEKRIENFNEFKIKLSNIERINQAKRCMDCGVPFCGYGEELKGRTVGCPLHNLIPEWNQLLSKGNFQAAYLRLSLTSPFPEFTSHVCPALCEKACSCNVITDHVSIRDNELAIIDYAFQNGLVKPLFPKMRRKEKVLIVGSGPAGLSCAEALNRKGFLTTIIEKNDRFGGLLMYGIPNMKLDKKTIERRISIMKESGITFINNCLLKDYKENYNALILAIGSGAPRDLLVKGRELKNIRFAVDFLSEITRNLLDNKPLPSLSGKKVVIIGGGDTGNDCVGTCLRLGAKEIAQLEIMPKAPLNRTLNNPWPEYPNTFRIDYGCQEYQKEFGIDPRIFQASVKEFLGQEQVKGVKIANVRFEEGKMIEEEPWEMECDFVLLAMGFKGVDMSGFEELDVSLSKKVAIEATSYLTNQPKIYSCGDAKNGPSLVVKAINDGLECAKIVERDLLKV